MKNKCVAILGALLLSLSLLVSHGEDMLHAFTTPDGRSLNAVIKEYNPTNKKIQIEREDGKKIWTLPAVFSKEDQEYIQQWIAVDHEFSHVSMTS